MTTTDSRLEITLTPSKVLAWAQLGLVASLSLLSILLPVLWWAKSFLLLVNTAVASIWLYKWRTAKAEVLVFYPPADVCFLGDGTRCWLGLQQFVTRGLIVLYLRCNRGKRISRIIPRGSLVEGQHRLLSKLLIQRQVDRGG